jgi:hypothetical protein
MRENATSESYLAQQLRMPVDGFVDALRRRFAAGRAATPRQGLFNETLYVAGEPPRLMLANARTTLEGKSGRPCVKSGRVKVNFYRLLMAARFVSSEESFIDAEGVAELLDFVQRAAMARQRWRPAGRPVIAPGDVRRLWLRSLITRRGIRWPVRPTS